MYTYIPVVHNILTGLQYCTTLTYSIEYNNLWFLKNIKKIHNMIGRGLNVLVLKFDWVRKFQNIEADVIGTTNLTPQNTAKSSVSRLSTITKKNNAVHIRDPYILPKWKAHAINKHLANNHESIQWERASNNI